MALLFRNRASRHYAIGSGALFLLIAVILGILAIIRPMSGSARMIGLVLAAILFSRGLFRLRQARNARDEAAAASQHRSSSAR